MNPRPVPDPIGTRTDVPSSPGGTIDFTMMEITHDAFRRDLRLLTEAASAGDATGFAPRWRVFKAQLLIHHGVEDTNLWPMVRTAARDRDGAGRLLDDMAREHRQLDPLLQRVERALTTHTGHLDGLLSELRSALSAHLDHEEHDALPLIQAVCTPADWRRFAGHMRRRQGLRGAATYVPWLLDHLDQAARRRVLAALPAPVRLLNRLAWERRYQQRTRSLAST